MNNISVLKELYPNHLFEAVYIQDGNGIFTISNSDISYRSDSNNIYYNYSELFDIACYRMSVLTESGYF
ncbi:MAG: hypothetical protein CFE24_15175 [Flavobacterium sp. BFFFF2]|nr:MAG: hypothetical protein CFE24_15175 [Flavobacterium sp. BFFFF2]